MSNKRIIAFLVAILSNACLSAGQAHGELLKLELGVGGQSEYFIYEPIPIHYTVHNKSDGEVFVRMNHGLHIIEASENNSPYYTGDVHLVVSGVDQNPNLQERRLNNHLNNLRGASPYKLLPGDSLNGYEYFYVSHEGHLILAEPGIYEFSLKLVTSVRMAKDRAEQRLELVSESLQIKILHSPADDFVALQTWRHPTVAMHFHYGLTDETELEQTRGQLRTLVSEHGESPYADYAAQALTHRFRELPIYGDPRLERPIGIGFDEPMPFTELFPLVTESTGVPLHLGPDIRTTAVRFSQDADQSLREFMRSLGTRSAEWIREGEGYTLVVRSELERRLWDSRFVTLDAEGNEVRRPLR